MKRKGFSPFSIAFIIYMALVLIGLAVFSGRVSVLTDFTSLIPSNGVPRGMAEAEKTLASRLNSRISLYVSHEESDTAEVAAKALWADIEDMFEDESLDITGLFSVYQEHRYQLLPPSITGQIDENPGLFVEESLARVFSPFTIVPLDNLSEDPFLIDELMVQEALSDFGEYLEADRGAPQEMDGRWYAVLQGRLKAENLNFMDTNGGVKRIFDAGDDIERRYDGVKVYYSGLAFHSYQSASSAQKEIIVIAVVTIVLILLMFAILLRSLYVLVLFLASTCLSLLSAVSALVVLFPEIHIFTLIFGTTLIGTSIDYAIHFYLGYARERDAGKTVRGLWLNLTTSFLSTAVCYLLLLLSPYDVLHQVAVFSLFGLLGSYLSAMGLFPLILSPRMVSDTALAWRLPKARKHRSFLVPLLVLSVLLLFAQAGKLEIHNDVSQLYDMSDRLMEGEMVAARLSGGASLSYTIIEGKDENEARELEERYLTDLRALKEEGVLEGFVSPGLLIPSHERQRQSFASAQALIPYIGYVNEILGLESRAVERLGDEPAMLDYEDIGLLSDFVPGEIDGKYYIAILLMGVTDGEKVKDLDSDAIRYFLKVPEVNRQLDELTSIMFKIFALAIVLTAVLLIALYRKRGLKIIASPVIIISLCLALSPAVGLDLEFFFAVALVLVMGLGIDYMVFASQEGEKPMLAVTLSYITTALSFGSLLFSSFPPVHIFGLTVFIGITAAFLTAIASGDKGSRC